MRGELLSVRDTSILVDTAIAPHGEQSSASDVAVVPLSLSQKAVLTRRSNVAKSALIGFLVGAVPGGILGEVVSRSNYSNVNFGMTAGNDVPDIAKGAAVVGAGGAVIGTLVGLVTPNGDEEFDLREKDQITALGRAREIQGASARLAPGDPLGGPLNAVTRNLRRRGIPPRAGEDKLELSLWFRIFCCQISE